MPRSSSDRTNGSMSSTAASDGVRRAFLLSEALRPVSNLKREGTAHFGMGAAGCAVGRCWAAGLRTIDVVHPGVCTN